MELSLLNLLSANGAGAPIPLKEGEQAAQAGEELYSFEQWLSDTGIADVTGAETPAIEGELLGDLAPNAVFAQGDLKGLTPAQVLAQLTGVDTVDAASIAQLNLTKPQAAKLAEMMQRYLQRPDVKASLGEQQRNVLANLAAQLQAVGEDGQPVDVVVKPFLTAQGVSPHEMKERAPVFGQVMKWLKQVLREGQHAKQQAAQTQTDAEALVPGAAQTGFPVGADAEATPTQSEEQTQEVADANLVVPVIVAPVENKEPVRPADAEDAHVRMVKSPAEKAEDLLMEAESLVVAGDDAEEAKPAQPSVKGISSTAFAEILSATRGGEEVMSDAMKASLVAQAAEPKAVRAQERVLGGSVSGDVKVLGMRGDDAALNVAPQTEQAVLAVSKASPVSGQQAQELLQTLVSGGTGTEVAGSSVTTASGFQVGQSNVLQHANAGAAHQAYARSAVPDQVHVAIKHAVKDDMDRMTIQLQPEELGRIDVRLDRQHDGRMHISFTVEKAETFEQLQRDARLLEKALQDAGVQTDAGSMEFNLQRQHAQDASGFGQGDDRRGMAEGFVPEDSTQAAEHADDADDDGALITANYTLNVDSGLDIRV